MQSRYIGPDMKVTDKFGVLLRIKQDCKKSVIILHSSYSVAYWKLRKITRRYAKLLLLLLWAINFIFTYYYYATSNTRWQNESKHQTYYLHSIFPAFVTYWNNNNIIINKNNNIK